MERYGQQLMWGQSEVRDMNDILKHFEVIWSNFPADFIHSWLQLPPADYHQTSLMTNLYVVFFWWEHL